MNKRTYSNPIFVTLVALICTALWGSATPFIKTGYELMLPQKDVTSTILFAGVRFTAAGIITIGIFSIGRRKILIPQKKNITRIMAVAGFQTVLQYIFFYIGLANTTGVKGTIASGTSAFFSILISSLFFRFEKLTFKKIFACILGFLGVILINLDGLDFKMNFTGDCFVIFSAAASGLSAVLIKKFSSSEDPVIISGYQFAAGGLFMIVVGILFGGNIKISGVSALIVLIYLAFLSAIAYTLWGILLKHNHVSKVTIFSFATPIFGVILSELMLAESSGVSLLNLIITLILISSGVIMINKN